MTHEITRKRGLALSMCLDYQNSLDHLRNNWRKGGWYEKQKAEKEAEIVKKKLNQQIGQYKIFCKKGLTPWQKSVIDNIF